MLTRCSGLVNYDAVWFDGQARIFRRTIPHSSAESRKECTLPIFWYWPTKGHVL